MRIGTVFTAESYIHALSWPDSSSSRREMTAPALESIHRSLSELCLSDDNFAWENPRRFSAYANRLQLVLNQFLRSSSPEALSPSVQTTLRGVSGDLSKAVEAVSVYRNRSKIFVLINCQSLCASLQEHTVAIGGWLALLESTLPEGSDLRKKVADLSQDMKQAQFRVSSSQNLYHSLCILLEFKYVLYVDFCLILHSELGFGERRESALYTAEGGTRQADQQSSAKCHCHGFSSSSRDRGR